MMELDDVDKVMLRLNGVPEFLIEIMAEWINDAWQHGHECGAGEYAT